MHDVHATRPSTLNTIKVGGIWLQSNAVVPHETVVITCGSILPHMIKN